MAYVTMDGEGYSGRVILGVHDEVVSRKKIQKGSTAILLEGSFSNPKYFFDRVTDKDTPDQQYHDVVNHAKTSKIPLVAAEPLWEIEHYRRYKTLSFKDKLLVALFGFIAMKATSSLVDTEGEVSLDDPRIATVRRWTNLTIASVPYMKVNGPFKDRVMAQRVTAFSEFQKAGGVRNPQLDLIVGINHIGVITALKMDSEERVREILDNQNGNRYVAPRNLALGHYSVYDARDTGGI